MGMYRAENLERQSSLVVAGIVEMVVVAVVVVGGAAGIVRMLPIPPLGSRDDWVIS